MAHPSFSLARQARLVAVVLIAFGVGYSVRKERVVTETVALTPQSFVERLESVQIENGRLRSIIEGLEARGPGKVYVVDTLFAPPDTVFLNFAVNDGELTVPRLVLETTEFYRPSILTYDVKNCDEGWSISGSQLICDKARLGHFSLFAEAVGLYPLGYIGRAGIDWQLNYQSAWVAGLAVSSDERIELSVRYRFF